MSGFSYVILGDVANAKALIPDHPGRYRNTGKIETERSTQMKNKKQNNYSKPVPELEALERELAREKYKNRYGMVLRSTIYTLITVAAVAILISTLWMPVLQIYGSSMNETLQDGDIVLSVKDSNMHSGDIIAFYYNNKILVKRVIAQAGDWVNIDADGNVYVNDVLLPEPYITKKALGECDIELPYQVPENRVFVMGDHREVSVDSRSATVGCVAEEQIVGKLVFRAWPLSGFGSIA